MVVGFSLSVCVHLCCRVQKGIENGEREGERVCRAIGREEPAAIGKPIDLHHVTD